MAFQPKFTITAKLLDISTKIAICKERVLRMSILPKREAILVRSARLRMIHSSTAIEGNPLNLKEVEDVLQGKTVTGAGQKDRLEIINYEKALKFIDSFAERKAPISQKIISKIHQIITNKILPKNESGHYRQGPVYIVKNQVTKLFTNHQKPQKFLF